MRASWISFLAARRRRASNVPLTARKCKGGTARSATAVQLFYPIGIAEFVHTGATAGEIILALVVGAILMAFPIVGLTLKSRPYFRQS